MGGSKGRVRTMRELVTSSPLWWAAVPAETRRRWVWWLGGRAVMKLGRGPADQLVEQALHRLKLALGEVRVVERKKDGKVVQETIANHDAIIRARKVYTETAHAIGVVKRASDAGLGPQTPTRGLVKEGLEKLEEYRRELERLQALS